MENASQALWTRVDDYFSGLLIPGNDPLESALQANQRAGLPAIDVSPLQGRFLEFLVRISGARRVLEIGTLGGYSTLCLARALPEGGRVVTLELDPRHAEVARDNFQNAGFADRIDLRLGPAVESLAELAESAAGPVPPFDLIFIDADKESYPDYLRWSLRLSRPGTILVADNVVRDGEVADAHARDPRVRGVRRFMELLAAEPRLSATVLQTLSVKGYDGFALAVVLP
jgi:predicted O-methyltransferase YrrM